MRNQSNTASERAAAAPRRDEAKRGALGRLFERLHTALLRDAGSAATGPAQAAEPGAAPGAAEPAAEARGAAAEPDGVASSSGEPAGEAVGRTDHGEQPGAGPAAAEGAECSGRDGGGGGGGGGGDKDGPLVWALLYLAQHYDWLGRTGAPALPSSCWLAPDQDAGPASALPTKFQPGATCLPPRVHDERA